MSIRISINEVLRSHTHGLDVVEVTGSTVVECLRHLVKQFPNIEERLFDKDGNLLSYIEIYVNEESVHSEGLLKPITEGDKISIALMIAGG